MKKQRTKIIKDKKQRGEWAEIRFMARAAEHGLAVSKPWGEMRPFDFVVGKTGRFVSVQVKSTVAEFKGGYVCTVRSAQSCYPAGAFDFLAAYVVLEDAWYIIPAKAIEGKDRLAFFPKSKKAKYEPYREAWHLLREAAAVSEEAEVSSNDNQAEAAPCVKDAEGPARNTVERMQAAMNFFRTQLERGGVRSEKTDEER